MYSPKPLPQLGDDPKLQALADWMQDELQAIARDFGETQTLELRPSAAAPEKPREGMIVYADGTNWDPGDGAGSYQYVGGAWVLQRSGAEPNSYGTVTDGTTPAPANSAGATFKLRADTGLIVTTQNDDATHGDNARYALALKDLAAVALTLSDNLAYSDVSNSGANAKATVQTLLDLVLSLTTESAPDFAADYLLLGDNSGSVAKKVALSNFNRPKTKISTTSLSGSSTTISIPSGYTDIEIHIRGLSPTNNVQPSAEYSEDGGSTFLSAPGGLTGTSGTASGADLRVIYPAAMSNTATLWCVLRIYDYLSSADKIHAGSIANEGNNSGLFITTKLTSTSAINAVKISVPAGTMDAGSVEIWGIH